jgi:ABC-type polysaccharide/polyol phosphate transport system ATPase subunit
MKSVIHVEDVSKAFSGLKRHRITKVLKRYLAVNGSDSDHYFALREISLDVFRGDKIAVIGNNGSGKTTLLKLIAGIYLPTRGRIDIDGRMLLLRGVGTGMLDELTVADNVFLYGIIYGMDRLRIQEKFAEVLEWGELTDFASAELRTLSSGMRARLAFSLTRHFDTDIFLLDEAFAVGDKDFREKYEEVFRSQKNGDRTYLIATHDLEFAKLFCNKTIWLHKGRLLAFGETEAILDRYTSPKRLGPES